MCYMKIEWFVANELHFYKFRHFNIKLFFDKKIAKPLKFVESVPSLEKVFTFSSNSNEFNMERKQAE